MRKIITLIILFITFGSSAQVWIDQNANWHYEYWSLGVEGFYNFKYTQDTLVGGQSCQQIEQTVYSQYFGNTSIDTSSIIKQFTYVNADTVFYWRDNQFFTLFNFGASIGDQWLIGIYDVSLGGLGCQDSSYVEVVDTSSIIINSTSYRTITLAPVGNSSIGLSGTFVERFGLVNISTSFHLFPRIMNCDPNVIVEWHILTFNCFEDDSFALYSPNGQECENISVGLNEPLINLSVFPNPITDVLNIEIEGDFSFELLNINGESLKEGASENLEIIDFSDLAAGLYLLIIEKNDQKETVRVINE